MIQMYLSFKRKYYVWKEISAGVSKQITMEKIYYKEN